MPSRPTGVSALTALMIIGGIFDLAVGVLSLALAAVTLSWLGVLAGLGPTGLVLSLVSFGAIVAGILSFVLAYGLWKGRSWAWTWTLISSILGLIISIIGITVGVGIIGIVIYAIIIYYLTRARVKSYFGKGLAPAEPARAFEPTAVRPPETAPTARPTIPGWKSGKYKILGLVILALLAGLVLGYSFGRPTLLSTQQATIYVTQYGYVTQPSYVYVTESRYISVTQTIGQGVTVYVTQTVTRTVPIATTTPMTEGPYVVIRYSSMAVDKIGYDTPAPGNTYLIVTMQIENHGYESFPAFREYFYVIVGTQQFKYSSSTYALPDELPYESVLDGLMIKGSIAFEVPADYGTFRLLYKHWITEYNVQYVRTS